MLTQRTETLLSCLLRSRHTVLRKILKGNQQKQKQNERNLMSCKEVRAQRKARPSFASETLPFSSPRSDVGSLGELVQQWYNQAWTRALNQTADRQTFRRWRQQPCRAMLHTSVRPHRERIIDTGHRLALKRPRHAGWWGASIASTYRGLYKTGLKKRFFFLKTQNEWEHRSMLLSPMDPKARCILNQS